MLLTAATLHGPLRRGRMQNTTPLVERCNLPEVALNIKNVEVEQLAEDVAKLTGESKTEAVRKALYERKQRLAHRIDPADREGRARRFLERSVWPHVPPDVAGRRLDRDEEDAILGYGPDGA